jgi:polysaccharide biosynthesis/export protein
MDNRSKKNMRIRSSVYLKKLIPFLLILGLVSAPGCSGNGEIKKSEALFATVRTGEGGLVSSGRYRGVAVADMDNDGNLDVVGGGASSGTVAIWYGQGSKGMADPLFIPIKGDIQSLGIADFNEDGFKDIVLSIQRESSGITVLINHHPRKWIKGEGPTEVNNYQGVQTADINRDGHMDIIAANATSDIQGGIQIWLGDGTGRWLVESGPTITGTFMDVTAADFDENGSLDIAAAGWGVYGSLRVWVGDGSGDWSAVSPLNEGSYYGVEAGDVNADGHLDILAGTYREGIQIFLGDGKGNFTRSTSPQISGSFWNVLSPDLDGDGLKDLLASSIDSGGIAAWRNDPSKGWLPLEGWFPRSGTYYDLAIADLNEDGRDDICAASFGEGVQLWFGKGGFPIPAKPKSIAQLSVSREKSRPKEVQENEVFTTAPGYPEYKIGPADVLEITLWKGPAANRELLSVRPDGKISFGYVEDLYIKGMTPSRLDDLLTHRLQEYVKNPRIDVLVKEFNSKSVTIMGAIGIHGTGSGAGKYELTGKSTVLEMLSKAGGPTRDANLRDVRIRRKNNQSFSVDLYKAITQGDRNQDIVLDDGDLIFIPTISKESNRVYVFGEVENPGVYTFSGSSMRLFDAVSQAGGITVFAHPESTKIVRGDITQPEVVSPNLKGLIEKGDQAQNITLANGDLVYVPRSFVGDVNLFVKRIRPILDLVFAPAQFRDEYNIAPK